MGISSSVLEISVQADFTTFASTHDAQWNKSDKKRQNHVSLAFRKLASHHFAFMKKPILVHVFAKWKESKENFHFYQQKQKVKTTFNVCFATRLIDRDSTHPEQQEWPHQSPSPGTTPSISASSCRRVELSENISPFFALILCIC